MVVKTRHNFYKQTKVTSHAQEEQSALPAGVLNTYEDTTDEEDFTGEQKEIASEMQALRAAQQWVNQEGWDAAGEAKAVDASGADVDLRVPTDAEGRPLTWGDVQRQLAKGGGMASDESALAAAVVEEEVVRDFALEKLDPTRYTAFAELFTPEEGRQGVVVTLLAILELLRERLIEMIQSAPFAPIHVRTHTA